MSVRASVRRALYRLWYGLWRVHYDRYMIGKSYMDHLEREILYGTGEGEPVGVLHAGGNDE
jgi:hypothetical protein